MTPLQLFTNALEEATGRRFVSVMSIEPLLKPAYKEVSVKLWEVTGQVNSLKFAISDKFRITNIDEKTDAVENMTTRFMQRVLEHFIQPKTL